MTMRIEVFSSPGCAKCSRARDLLRRLAEEVGGGRIEWRDVDVLEELDYAVRLGVLSTPAVAVDGELVFTSLPSARRLRAFIEQRLGRRP
jgi:predicted thioredoxin/glutaredoxin